MKEELLNELLHKLSEGNLTPEEEKLLKQYYRDQFYNNADLEDIGDEDIKENIHHKIHEHISQRTKSFTYTKSFRLKCCFSAAAVLLLLIMVNKFYSIKKTDLNKPIDQSITVKAETKNLKTKLPDSSYVIISPHGMIRYKKDFNDKVRSVKLEGEACFSVIHNADKPFVVECNHLSVTDVGTVFTVSSTKQNKYTNISVLEGEVSVRNAGKSLGNLTASGKLTVNIADGTLFKETVDLMDDNAWMHDSIDFKDNGLDKVFAYAEKEYHIHITTQNFQQDNKHFTGSFPAGTSLKTLINTLSIIFKFNYTYDKSNMTLNIE